tara:strand:- start:2030 stop:2665 length:636 start_codon:yes stop_codon:yes gene_type:complete
MYAEKYFYFSNGGGLDAFGEAYCYPQSNFMGMRPHSSTKLDLFFKPLDNSSDVTINNSVRLTVVDGKMGPAIANVLQKIDGVENGIIYIADIDNGLVCSEHITAVDFFQETSILYYNKITNATQVNVIPEDSSGLWKRKLTSMTLANIHSSAATASVFLANATDNWYIVKDVVIPVGSTLKLERDELDYDWDIWSLYVKLGGTTPVDVIVR